MFTIADVSYQTRRSLQRCGAFPNHGTLSSNNGFENLTLMSHKSHYSHYSGIQATCCISHREGTEKAQTGSFTGACFVHRQQGILPDQRNFAHEWLHNTAMIIHKGRPPELWQTETQDISRQRHSSISAFYENESAFRQQTRQDK